MNCPECKKPMEPNARKGAGKKWRCCNPDCPITIIKK